MEPKKVFFTIEILYLSIGDGTQAPELRRHTVSNLTRDATDKVREYLFTCGFSIRIDSDTEEIVNPARVQRVYLLRQAHFFKDYQRGELTNPESKLVNRKY